MTKSYALSDYASIVHPGIKRHAVRDAVFQNMEIKKPIEGITFKEFCLRLLDDWDSNFPHNLNNLTRVLDSGFRFEGEELVQAKLYLLTVLIGHGMVPMTYGYGDYEYDPEYAYGENPQEIIDNLHADWCARELDTPDMPALMLGWERECGGFYPDEEGEADAG